MRPTGLFLIAAATAAPLPWFAALADGRDAVALFSQYLGVAALIAMGLSQMLATRLPGLETVFGGLDRIYVLHKWLGIGALAAILLHDTIDAEMAGARETLLSETGETFGEISLYGLLVLVTLSVATFVPYPLWRYTHKAMGAFFTLGALHYALISKPFSLNDPVGLYALAFCAIGVAAYLYTLVPPGVLRRPYSYRVGRIRQTGDALAIDLTPTSQALKHRAGQFAVVSFPASGLHEPHPFTISRAPDGTGSLRFTVKPLGDYTERLHGALMEGAPATVSGPHGRFLLPRSAGEQVWIAGGIGITPFLAWAETLKEDAGPVHLFYCVRARKDAAHLDDVREIAAAAPNLSLHLIESSQQGRLTAQQIVDTVQAPPARLHVAFCGPKPMRETLRRDLQALGLPGSRFAYEEFEFRSGIGLRRAFRRLIQRPRGQGTSQVPAEA